MLKGSGFLFLIPCAMMLGLWGLSAVPSDLDCPEASEKLARRLQSRRLFAAFLERTLADLSQGTLTLRQASAALLAYSRAFHKDYLVNMHWAEEGATQLEMVARNCVRHFRWNIECEDLYEASAVLERLERQLDQIISDEASGTEALAPQQPAQGPGPLLQSKNGSRTQAAVAPEGRGACFM